MEIASRFSRKHLVEQYKNSLLLKHTDPGTVGSEGEEQDKDEINRLWWGSMKQQIPFLIGRLMAHTTSGYHVLNIDLDTVD